MSFKSVPELIIDVLIKENRLTINEIREKAEIPKEEKDSRKEYFRLSVIRLANRKKIVKDGMRGKQYLYSLKEKATSDRALLKTLYNVMSEDMDVKQDRKDNFIANKEVFKKIKERI